MLEHWVRKKLAVERKYDVWKAEYGPEFTRRKVEEIIFPLLHKTQFTIDRIKADIFYGPQIRQLMNDT